MCSGCIELGEIIHDLANYDTIQEVKDVLREALNKTSFSTKVNEQEKGILMIAAGVQLLDWKE